MYDSGFSMLPGFEAVLREHKRLAYKLTSDEIRAIREYIEQRIRQDHADVSFQLFTLRSEYDVTARRYSETISDLNSELLEKKEIIKQYQSTDKNVTHVIRQREGRWEKQQETLRAEMNELKNEVTETESKLSKMEADFDQKVKEVAQLEYRLEEANKIVNTVEEMKVAVKKLDDAHVEILRLKLEVDKKDRVIHGKDRALQEMKEDIARIEKEKTGSDVMASTFQDELRKQLSEVAAKCEDLSRLQFQLQIEKRQTETLQSQLREATDDVNNFKRMLETSKRPHSPRDNLFATLRKDLDMNDIRVRCLDITVKSQMEEIRKVNDQLNELKEDATFVQKVKEAVTGQSSRVELPVEELVKRYGYRERRLCQELKCTRDWQQARREADVLFGDITALMKQASMCKAKELSDRAAKQLGKLDLIMRGTEGDNKKTKCIYEPLEKSTISSQTSTTYRPVTITGPRPAFVASSSGGGTFDKCLTTSRMSTPAPKPMRRHSAITRRRCNRPVCDSRPNVKKVQFISTVQLGLNRVNPTRPQKHSGSRLPLKSLSTGSLISRAE